MVPSYLHGIIPKHPKTQADDIEARMRKRELNRKIALRTQKPQNEMIKSGNYSLFCKKCGDPYCSREREVPTSHQLKRLKENYL